MRIPRRALTGLLAVVVLVLAAQGAAAATVTVEPAGANRITNEGNVILEGGFGQVVCEVVTFDLNFNREARGVLNVLNISEDIRVGSPRAGTVTAGRTERCRALGAARITFLNFPWRIWVREVIANERVNLYTLEVQVRIDEGFTIECLVRALVELQYDERTNRVRITSTRILEAPRGTRCGLVPIESTFRGSFNLQRRVRITLRA